LRLNHIRLHVFSYKTEKIRNPILDSSQHLGISLSVLMHINSHENTYRFLSGSLNVERIQTIQRFSFQQTHHIYTLEGVKKNKISIKHTQSNVTYSKKNFRTWIRIEFRILTNLLLFVSSVEFEQVWPILCSERAGVL